MDVTSDTLVVVQAVAAAMSAATALGLAMLTVYQHRQVRAEQNRDHEQEQLRRIIDALQAVRESFRDSTNDGFDLARVRLSGALAMRAVSLPATERLLAPDMLEPPYTMADRQPFERMTAARDELREYARSLH